MFFFFYKQAIIADRLSFVCIFQTMLWVIVIMKQGDDEDGGCCSNVSGSGCNDSSSSCRCRRGNFVVVPTILAVAKLTGEDLGKMTANNYRANSCLNANSVKWYFFVSLFYCCCCSGCYHSSSGGGRCCCSISLEGFEKGFFMNVIVLIVVVVVAVFIV